MRNRLHSHASNLFSAVFSYLIDINGGVTWPETLPIGFPVAVAPYLGAFTLTGATNVDWEDIAVGPGPAVGTSYLYVADTGNNNNPKRSAVDFRPAIRSSSLSWCA